MRWSGLSRARHRLVAERGERDTLVFAAKIAVAVLLTGVLVSFVLMAANGLGGGADEVAVTDPPVPTITDSGAPSTDDAEPAPAPPPEAVAPPAVGTQTAVMSPRKPKPTARPTAGRPGIPGRFERPGKRCRPDGAIAFTKRFEPLVCENGRWHRMFRTVG